MRPAEPLNKRFFFSERAPRDKWGRLLERDEVRGAQDLSRSGVYIHRIIPNKRFETGNV